MILKVLFFSYLLTICVGSKYSKEANEKDPSVTEIGNVAPFRMRRINVLWEKAQRILAAPKLKALAKELSVQDKEELAFKRLKSQGADKDGSKEATVVASLSRILKKYGLGDVTDPEISHTIPRKRVFKDKKLHKIWEKAQKSLLKEEELKVLEEEFEHVQDKIDQYELLHSNILETGDDSEIFGNDSTGKQLKKIDSIRSHHNQLKKEYRYLENLSESLSNHSVFSEPEVLELWKTALNSQFSHADLVSFKVELQHFEHRLRKVRDLKEMLKHYPADEKIDGNIKTDDKDHIEERITRNSKTIEKIRFDISSKLTSHMEL